MNKPLFSIIIPVRVETEYLKETLQQLKKQTYQNFEVIVVSDKTSGPVSPAIKRNLGAQKAKGQYLCFLDDDSYPDKNWLSHARDKFSKKICAVCGPCLTPASDNLLQKASGLVWQSYLGSGGAGRYRNAIAPTRFVDDYPSVNLIVRKTEFNLVKGFDTHHWPGEDTILCLNLTHTLHKKILYHPEVVVYHHRRQAIIPHLQQITRYALHRGNFARIYPQTSLRIGYLLPSLFLIYCLLLPIIDHIPYTVYPLYLYLSLLCYTFFDFLINGNNPLSSLVATITIPLTHLYYGLLFIKGFFTPTLDFTPHNVDNKNHKYLGG